MHVKSYLLTIATIAVAGVLALPPPSMAMFTAQTITTATLQGSTDWAPPVVTLADPGAVVSGTVTVGATATDDRSGIANVLLEYAPAGGPTWTALCAADATAPYSCSWNTTAIADGQYQLRATATDAAGHSAESAGLATQVINTLTVTLANPGTAVHGTVALQAAVYNAPAGTTLQLQSKRSTKSNWALITGCSTTATTLATTLNCSWDTAGLTDSFDLQAVADVSGTSYTDVVANLQVDNTAPTVALIGPGSPLSGSATLSASAGDADSGLNRVEFSYAPTGTSSWTAACTATNGAVSCAFDSTAVANGSYRFRAIGIDNAGNPSAASTVDGIVIDNTLATVSLVDPGTALTGTVTLQADANSGAGVTSVRIQQAVAGSSAYADICTDNSSPYSCAWDTTAVADGSHDLRAVLLQGDGATLTSTVLTVSVDNVLLSALDVQSVNGGATAGKPEPGDQLVFTFSHLVDPASIKAGWDGQGSTTVIARFSDGKVVGTGSSDQFSVDAVNLGTVALNADYIKNNQAPTAAAKLQIATQLVAGVNRSVITITLTQAPANTQTAAAAAASMIWTPSAAIKDLAGRAGSTAPVTESGTIDKDF